MKERPRVELREEGKKKKNIWQSIAVDLSFYRWLVLFGRWKEILYTTVVPLFFFFTNLAGVVFGTAGPAAMATFRDVHKILVWLTCVCVCVLVSSRLYKMHTETKRKEGQKLAMRCVIKLKAGRRSLLFRFRSRDVAQAVGLGSGGAGAAESTLTLWS